MSKTTLYIIRTKSILLALLVLKLSSGFTFYWQSCLHADAEPICSDVDQICCCSETPQTAKCLCVDIGDKSCELSFSKYIQFNFETQLSDSFELQPKLVPRSQATQYFSFKECFLQNINFFHNLPPPKCGRKILNLYSVLVV